MNEIHETEIKRLWNRVEEHIYYLHNRITVDGREVVGMLFFGVNKTHLVKKLVLVLQEQDAAETEDTSYVDQFLIDFGNEKVKIVPKI